MLESIKLVKNCRFFISIMARRQFGEHLQAAAVLWAQAVCCDKLGFLAGAVTKSAQPRCCVWKEEKFHRANQKWNFSQSELLESGMDLCYNGDNRGRCESDRNEEIV